MIMKLLHDYKATDDRQDEDISSIELKTELEEGYQTVAENINGTANRLEAEIDVVRETKMDRPQPSPYGLEGQLLRSNGDGTTQWADQGLPSDAQTQAALSAWMEEHPEAAIVDDSVTKKKLAPDVRESLNEVSELKSAIVQITDSTRNLFNDTTIVIGSLTPSGVINSDTFNWTSDYIDVESDAFVISWENPPADNYLRVGFYDENKEFDHRDLLTIASGQRSKTIPNANRYRYIRVSLNTQTTKVQVEKGTTASSYIHHYNAVDIKARYSADAVASTIAEYSGTIPLDNVQVVSTAYINYVTGAEGTYDRAPYEASDYIDIGGLAGAHALMRAVFNGVAGIAFYDSENTYISGVGPNDVGGSSLTPQTVNVVIPNTAKYARITLAASDVIGNYPIYSSETFISLDKQITSVKETIDYNVAFSSLSVFEKLGIIGDSYASGEIVVNGVYTDYYSLSWGQNIARMCGIECTNYSKGGLTTKTWLTDSHGLPQLLSDNNLGLYMLCLGLNDHTRIAAGTYALGTEDDLTSDYAQNPDTFYGNYGRIIGNILSHAPNAKIIICTVTEGVENDFADVNSAIPIIAEHFGIPLIRLQDDPFFSSVFYRASMVANHPTAVAYAGYAQGVMRLFSKCAAKYVNYFKDYVGV